MTQTQHGDDIDGEEDRALTLTRLDRRPVAARLGVYLLAMLFLALALWLGFGDAQ